jgi:hypothetical protein
MTETNLQAEVQLPPNTNAEYINSATPIKETAVIPTVTKAIFVDTIRDFFGGIKNFFKRYFVHFIRCFAYFWNPSLQKKPFRDLNYKENSQHAFEFVIIILALLLFMIKVGWVPEPNEASAVWYENELMETLLDVFVFLLYAILYVSFAILSVLIGRLLRVIFRLKLPRTESDILLIYLNNAFFSFTAVSTLFIRSIVSTATHEEESISAFLAQGFIFPIIVLTLLWAIRFCYLHKVIWWKSILYVIFSVSIYTIFYLITSYIVCMNVLNL